MDVGTWLARLGLSRYEQVFRDNDVDDLVLPSLTGEDLTELGVTTVGHRRKLLNAIAALRDGGGTLAHDATHEDGEAPPADGAPSARPPEPVPVPVPEPRAVAPVSRSPEAERRQLTVLFCDLVGSTALSTTLDPEDYREVISAFHRRTAAVVAAFEGHVAQYLGDGVLAYFGYPHAHENEAERAVLAGLEMVESVHTLRPQAETGLQVRVGIATGLAVVGDLLAEGTREGESAVGETPNLAARLQALAVPGAVVVGDRTRQMLGALFEFADLGTHPLKGFADGVRAWQVLRAGSAEGRFEAMHAGQLPPLLGREHELGLLLDRWEQAQEGEGQVVLLSGEPGIGKSRMVRALRERLAGETYTSLSHYCLPYYTNTALYPVASMLRRTSGLAPGDSPAEQLEKLERLLSRSQSDLADAVPLLAALLAIPAAAGRPPVDLPPQRQKQRTIEVLHDQLAGLAGERPVLSVYEDVHWADPSTLELLESMVAHVQRLPVLLVLTFRPEFRPPWGGYPHVTALTLSRLPQRRASSLIEQLTAAKPLPPELVQQIIAKTDGVPLFIEELTKVVLESGLIRDSGDRFVLAGTLSPLAIPATLHDSLMARLDRLAPVKEVAQIGAAIGREFSYPLLRAIAGRPEEELRHALDQLVAAELVFRRGVPPLATYSFKHALVQEAAYESLLRSRRRELHATIARTLSSGEASGPEASPEVVAEHYTRAGLEQEAARYWLEAGQRAKAAYANREAASHLKRCLDVLESTGQRPGDGQRTGTEVAALTLLGDLAGLAGDLRGANRRYEEALSRAADPEERTRLANKLHHQDVVVRNGARIAFYRHGGRGPVLVLVNPLVYGLAMFQPVLERLCQEFRIITIDSRGTGDSDPLRPPFPLREHAADVARVIEAVGGPVVGVGLSRGSNLLIRLAVERPELLSALVTVDCPLVEGGFDGLESFSDYWAECPSARQRGDVEALLRILSTYMYTEPGAGELQRALVERGLRLPPETVLSFYDPDPDVDVSGLLGRVRVPTLVMHGREDRIIPLDGAEYLHREIPGARLHVFEGKGHLPIFTATDEFCAVLREFVATSLEAAGTVAAAARPTSVSGG